MNSLWAAGMNGLRELWANRMRSLLSMSGIILGVTALATMLAVAEGLFSGFREFVHAQGGVERIGIVRSALPREQEHLAPTARGLTLRDADSIRNGVPTLAGISPEIEMGEPVVARSGKQINARLTGCSPDYLGVNRRSVAKGRFITDIDSLTRAHVCVIGDAVADTLFPADENPVGRSVTVEGRRFVVVGVLDRAESAAAAKGRESAFARWKNLTVCIPVRTAITRLTGDDRITTLVVRAAGAELVSETGMQLETVLLQNHRGLRDFRVETNEATIANFRKTERTFVYSLGGVAVVALLIGGAGIMNVMLASINERTREIGVRLALGARGSDIFTQFLLESVVVGAFGGVLGLVGAFGMITTLDALIRGEAFGLTQVGLSHTVMLIGVAFSCTIGLLAGVYPALRASRFNPIEALRSE